METFLGTLAGIAFGGIISYLVSRFYYKKTIKTKNLSCYVQFISEILTDIDPDVKQKLEIDYDGQKVESIYQTQLIIANTGDFSIKDIIRPLTLKIPNKAEVLDATIIHIEPSGREINFQIVKNVENHVEFIFPLLNSGEYFIVKLLVKGNPPMPEEVKDEDGEVITSYYTTNRYELFKFKITAEDLPPEIASERLPNDYSNYYQKEVYDKSTLLALIFIGLPALAFGYILYELKNIRTDLFLFNFSTFFSEFSIFKFCIIIGWLVSLILAIIAVMIPISELSTLRPKKAKTKFTLPTKLDRNRRFKYWD